MDAMLHRRTLRHGRTASTQKPKLTRLASFRKRQEKNDSSLQTPRAAARVVEGRGRGTAAARETLPRTNTFGCTRLWTTARTRTSSRRSAPAWSRRAAVLGGVDRTSRSSTRAEADIFLVTRVEASFRFLDARRGTIAQAGRPWPSPRMASWSRQKLLSANRGRCPRPTSWAPSPRPALR